MYHNDYMDDYMYHNQYMDDYYHSNALAIKRCNLIIRNNTGFDLNLHTSNTMFGSFMDKRRPPRRILTFTDRKFVVLLDPAHGAAGEVVYTMAGKNLMLTFSWNVPVNGINGRYTVVSKPLGQTAYFASVSNPSNSVQTVIYNVELNKHIGPYNSPMQGMYY